MKAAVARSAPRKFQSSAAPKDGCNDARIVLHRQVADVSILSRPEGRLQPARANRPRVGRQTFQSSAAPKDGCNDRQPEGVYRILTVSILSRPEGRLQRCLGRTSSGG